MFFPTPAFSPHALRDSFTAVNYFLIYLKLQELLDYAVSQQNIVIQASQALNLSLNGEEKKGCPEIIEGERLLLLASK